MQVVAHAFLLRLEVTLVVLIGFNFDGYILNDFKAVSFEANALYRVVGHKTHFAHTKKVEDLCTDAVVAQVGVVAQVNVGVNGIKALFLQLISCDFCHKTDATTFLIEVEHNSLAFFFHHTHSTVKLFATIATRTAEDVTRCA